MKSRNILAAAPLFLALIRPASASAAPGQWSLTLTPGWAAPAGHSGKGDRFQDENGGSFHMGAGLNYELEEYGWFGVEMGLSTGHKFEGRFDRLDLDGDRTNDSVTYTSDMRTVSFHLTPIMKVGGSFEADIRYYFSLGAGPYFYWRDAGTATLTGTGTTGASLNGKTVPFANSSHAYMGFNIGHGLGYEVADHVELGMDVRYHMVFRPGELSGIIIPGGRLTVLF